MTFLVFSCCTLALLVGLILVVSILYAFRGADVESFQISASVLRFFAFTLDVRTHDRRRRRRRRRS